MVPLFVGFVLVAISVVVYIRMYMFAIRNHQQLYEAMLRAPTSNETAMRYAKLLPNQHSPIALVLAAEYPAMCNMLGFRNMYTPIYADIAAKTELSGAIIFSKISEVIYRSETEPNIRLDDLWEEVIEANPTESYIVPHMPKPNPEGRIMGYFNTALGIIGTGMMGFAL